MPKSLVCLTCDSHFEDRATVQTTAYGWLRLGSLHGHLTWLLVCWVIGQVPAPGCLGQREWFPDARVFGGIAFAAANGAVKLHDRDLMVVYQGRSNSRQEKQNVVAVVLVCAWPIPQSGRVSEGAVSSGIATMVLVGCPERSIAD